jgi:hypothetical protein
VQSTAAWLAGDTLFCIAWVTLPRVLEDVLVALRGLGVAVG